LSEIDAQPFCLSFRDVLVDPQLYQERSVTSPYLHVCRCLVQLMPTQPGADRAPRISSVVRKDGGVHLVDYFERLTRRCHRSSPALQWVVGSVEEDQWDSAPYGTHFPITKTINTGFGTDTHRHVYRLRIEWARTPTQRGA